MTYPIPQTVDI